MTQFLKSSLLVFLGAGLGGILRHGVNRTGLLLLGMAFPWSTLFVNLSGCFMMGLIAGWLSFRGESSQALRLFLTTGVLGGYTTFSAFALDVALLWERGQTWGVVWYVVSSVLLSILGVFAGLAVMRQ